MQENNPRNFAEDAHRRVQGTTIFFPSLFLELFFGVKVPQQYDPHHSCHSHCLHMLTHMLSTHVAALLRMCTQLWLLVWEILKPSGRGNINPQPSQSRVSEQTESAMSTGDELGNNACPQHLAGFVLHGEHERERSTTSGKGSMGSSLLSHPYLSDLGQGRWSKEQLSLSQPE